MDELPIRREFGRRVRRRRLALDLFQKDLARQIGMPPAQLSRLEKGGYRSINIAKLIQLADALHTSTDYLLARSDDPGPVPNRIAPVAASCLRGQAPLPAGNRKTCRPLLYIGGIFMEQKWTDYLDKRSHPLSATANYRARVIKKHDVHLLRAKDSTGRTGCYFLYIPQLVKPPFSKRSRNPRSPT